MKHRILEKVASEITNFNGSERKGALGVKCWAAVMVVGIRKLRGVWERFFETHVPQILWPL